MLEPFDAAALVYFDIDYFAAGFGQDLAGESCGLGRVDLDADGAGRGPLAAGDGPVAEKCLDIDVMWRDLVDDPLIDAGAGLASGICHAGMVAESGGGVKVGDSGVR